MIHQVLATFGSIFIVSLLSLTGVLILALKETAIRRHLPLFISLAVGALLGNAFLHLIPEALLEAEHAAWGGFLVIAGMLLFFLLEKGFHWHHHGEDPGFDHPHPVGKLILVSDALHNFLDGAVIAASFAVSIPVGVATTVAVMLHEIPQEIGDFSVLLYAGYSKVRALFLNFLSALCAFLGAIFFFALGDISDGFAAYFIPITAGGFIYIAIVDLIPELQKTHQITGLKYQLMAVFLGIGLMALFLIFE